MRERTAPAGVEQEIGSSPSPSLVPRARAFDFNQALMDFGAMQCTARKPACLVCPMAKFCRAYPYTPPQR